MTGLASLLVVVGEQDESRCNDQDDQVLLMRVPKSCWQMADLPHSVPFLFWQW